MKGTQIYDLEDERVRSQMLRKLYQKIHTEFLSFEKEMSQLSVDEVFRKASEINQMEVIYEKLLASAPGFSCSQIEKMLEIKDLIRCCYNRFGNIINQEELLSTQDIFRLFEGEMVA